MQSFISNSYAELFELAGNYHNFPKPSADHLLQNMGYRALSLNAQAPIFYAGDYTQGKYLYLDPSCELLLGYNKEYIASAGQHFFNSLIHPADYRIFNTHVFPENMRFLQHQPAAERLNYSCSYNYRVKVRAGHYITVLQRSTYYLHPITGHPLASVGFIIDISHFKEGSSIVHTIERIDRNFSVLSAEPVLKAVYYPDKEVSLLSKRETEILQLIVAGSTS
jgi:PAS domain-containing protein